MPGPDLKPPKVIRDPELLKELHLRWRFCVLCGETWPLNLHHIATRDDLEANLVMLCGSGTTGCHGAITVNDSRRKCELAAHIYLRRHDTIAYLDERFPIEGADAWIKRRLGG